MKLSKIQKERYSRQLISESIGEKGQEKLLNASVLQIGAGGLGSPCSMYLAAAGIGKLTIIDNDTVSISNLQRQILYDEDDLDKIKIEIAKEKLEKINSDVKIEVFQDYIDENSIKKYLDEIDFIIDCSDNLTTKFLINRVAIKNQIKAVIAGIKDFYGQIMTINPGSSACYECVFTNTKKESTQESPLPVIGTTPGILGTLEALEVIKTVLELPNLENKLLMVNLLNTSFNKIKIMKDEDCFCRNLS